MSGRQWTAAQLEAINARDCELAVSAAAGSGKTSVLVERVLRSALGQVLGPEGLPQDSPAPAVPLDRLLIATFTNAAAAELRARLHEELARELKRRIETGQPTHLLREQLALLPLATIGTLHSFCLELIRRYGHERGLGASRVLSEHESRLLLHEQASRFLDEKLGSSDPAILRLGLDWGGQDGVGAEDLSRSSAGRGLRPLLLLIYELRRSLPDHEAWYSQHLDWPLLDPGRFDPGHPLLAALTADWDARIATLARDDVDLLTELAGVPDKEAYPHLLARRAGHLERAGLHLGWDGLREYITINLEVKQDDLHFKPTLLGKYHRLVADDDPRLADRVRHNKQQAQELFEELKKTLARPWAEVAGDENHVQAQLKLLWALAGEFEARMDSHKRERGWLDYSDMERGALELLSARDSEDRLLRGSDGGLLPSAIALELRGKYLALLVDEYQDTSPLQAALLELVCAEMPLRESSTTHRPRFVVGDVKQSIYSFRLAEPALFINLQERLKGSAARGEAHERLVLLRENFRSRRGVVAGINRLLSGLMTPELGGEDYDSAALVYSAGYEQHEPAAGPGGEGDGPALLRLTLVPEPDALGSREEDLSAGDQISAEDLEADTGSTAEESAGDEAGAPAADDSPELQRCVYRAVAGRLLELKSLAQAGRLEVLDHAEKIMRPADWGDMVILLRSSKGRVETLREELERAGVPCLALGRSGFYERPEVLDALSLLKVIDNPLQDVALAAVLRGPALGLSAAELLQAARPEVFARAAQGADLQEPESQTSDSEYEAADWPGDAEREGTDPDGASDTDGPLDSQLPPGSSEPLWQRLRFSAGQHPDAALSVRLQLFIKRLDYWRDLARSEPLHQLLHRLYREAGLLAAAAAQDRAEQRRANLEELLRLAGEFSAFERQGISRFLLFIESSRMAAGDSGEAVLSSAAGQQVRILTVHQSKGLEFPIVLLPDLHRQFNEQDLRSADVLWHPRAGLGGRFYDLQGRPPRRSVTLALERVRRARRRDLLSEELRLLYVAMTRARERLELISGLPRRFKAEEAVEAEPQAARRWLDWLARQLGPQLLQCLASGAAELREGEAHIELALALAGAAGGPSAEPQDAAQSDPLLAAIAGDGGARLALLLAREQAARSELRLPGKLTVSHLSHSRRALAGLEGELDSEARLSDDAAAQTDLSRYAPPRLSALAAGRAETEAGDTAIDASSASNNSTAAAEPDPRAIGTATHRLLAELDPAAPQFERYSDVAALTALRDGLLARGQLDAAAAGALNLAAVGRYVRDCAPLFAGLLAGSGRCFRELPVGLLVPGIEVAEALSASGQLPEGAELAAHSGPATGADYVYVQGTLDLLLVGTDTALVLDYKTDRGASAEALLERYSQQLEWYARAARLLLPQHSVRWAIYGLDRAGLVLPEAR